jgi:predicted ester cyclase
MSEQLDKLKMIFERIDAHEVDAAVELMGEGVRLNLPGASDLDGTAFKEYTKMFHDAFPDAHHNFDVILEQGDDVAIEGRWTGTHTGTMVTPQGDVPATGKTVTIHWAGLFSNAGSQGSRARLYFDQMEFATQLGLVPANA